VPPHRLFPPSPHTHPPQQRGQRDVEKKSRGDGSKRRWLSSRLSFRRQQEATAVLSCLVRRRALLSRQTPVLLVSWCRLSCSSDARLPHHARVSSRVPARTCALSYSRHSCMRPLIHAYTLTRIGAYTCSRLHACTHTLILDASTRTYKHLWLTRIHIHTRWRTHTGWIALRQRENL
jgi:hypothetical protein